MFTYCTGEKINVFILPWKTIVLIFRSIHNIWTQNMIFLDLIPKIFNWNKVPSKWHDFYLLQRPTLDNVKCLEAKFYIRFLSGNYDRCPLCNFLRLLALSATKLSVLFANCIKTELNRKYFAYASKSYSLYL